MLLLAWFVGGIYAVSVAVLIIGVMSAPRGWEDRRGFHRGDEPRRGPREPVGPVGDLAATREASGRPTVGPERMEPSPLDPAGARAKQALALD